MVGEPLDGFNPIPVPMAYVYVISFFFWLRSDYVIDDVIDDVIDYVIGTQPVGKVN